MNLKSNAPLQCWDLIVVGFARIPQHTKTLGILTNPTTQNVLPQQRSGALFKKRSPLQVDLFLVALVGGNIGIDAPGLGFELNWNRGLSAPAQDMPALRA